MTRLALQVINLRRVLSAGPQHFIDSYMPNAPPITTRWNLYFQGVRLTGGAYASS